MEKLKQSASQVWCLLRSLPFLIGDNIEEGDRYWELYLRLREIVDFCFAPRLSLNATYTMEFIISEHHQLFLEVGSYFQQ